ncbi:MAG: hypothetical protein F6K54_15900 [Okeania sp. SIO3B5]|uniref:hypothetical protein n=1 Tax=Okeania sp. SIO3B5 TaxID=2607811 RepID=UPI001400B7A0|nr:hypothetical protein [Okeania sp. SIO3B5]NEO54435.1 hypothetical protein [Okeania sp. SIO3B5]
MKVFRFVPILAIVALLWLPFSQPASADAQVCPSATLSSSIPHEVNEEHPGSRQTDFDCFSWQSLVGLSWAAKEGVNGEPDTNIDFGKVGKRGLVVWQTYKNSDAVFPQNDNPNPCPGGKANCWNTPLAGGENLYATSKSGGFLDGQVEALPNAWLTDQNGQLTRYEILVNRDEFDFIVKNDLYDGSEQKKYKHKIDMPEGKDDGPVGPIELKAAWKIISQADNKDDYFWTVATIQDTKINPENGYPDPNGQYMTCKGSSDGICDRTVGLVGFHIAHKVKDNPQWVWSTFEHKNNAPIQEKGKQPQVVTGTTYSYFNKDCGSGKECTKNTNPRDIPIPVTTPNQITRYLDPHYGGDKILPKKVNDRWHELVKDTPWENYELISTQWPTAPESGDPCFGGDPNYCVKTGSPTPEILANITMETYIQGDNLPNGNIEYASSCIKCHALGALLNGKKADFSYLFSKAKPN